MARLWIVKNYTLVNKYKISINTTLQSNVKILNKCSCVSQDTKWFHSPLRFVAISFSYCLKSVFLRKSCDAPLCFPEPWFGFPTFVRTHAATFARAWKVYTSNVLIDTWYVRIDFNPNLGVRVMFAGVGIFLLPYWISLDNWGVVRAMTLAFCSII